jgi:hypothetical protein
MSEKDTTLATIHKLIDEQMEALRGKLTAAEAERYAKRNRQIEELLERISQNHFETK